MSDNLILSNSSDCVATPQHTMSDYVKIIYLAVLFLTGCCVNLVAADRLGRVSSRYKHCHQLRDTMVHSLHRIKCHLNKADLCILLLYCLSEMCWLMTYSWHAGDATCRVTQFARTFAFYSASGLMVCIALNRYCSLYPPRRHKLLTTQHARTTLIVTLAWSMATVCSLPQLFTWKVIATPLCNNELWYQCANIWDGWDSQSVPVNASNKDWRHSIDWPFWYQIYHLSLVFWLPLIAIVFIYGLLVCRLHRAQKLETKMTVIITNYDEEDLSLRPTTETQLKDTISMLSPINGPSPIIETSTMSKSSSRASNASILTIKKVSQSTNWRMLHQAQVIAIRTSAVVVAVYVATYIPYATLQTAKAVLGADWYVEATSASDWLNALIVLHSVINPFLYGAFSVVYDFDSTMTDHTANHHTRTKSPRHDT